MELMRFLTSEIVNIYKGTEEYAFYNNQYRREIRTSVNDYFFSGIINKNELFQQTIINCNEMMNILNCYNEYFVN